MTKNFKRILILSKRVKIIILVAVILAGLAILDYLQMPSNTFFWRSAFDFGHIPLFGVISISFLGLSKGLFRSKFKSRYIHYLIAFFLTSFLGVLTEALQYYSPRDADFMDVVRDTVGAICFLGFYLTFDGEKDKNKDVLSPKIKNSIRVVVVLILIAALIPTGIWAYAFICRANSLPVICDFESKWENKFLYSDFASLEIVKFPMGIGGNKANHAEKIRFNAKPGVGSAFYIEEPYPDWTSYKYFLFDIYSEYADPFNLMIRINDRTHNQDSSDRFNRKLIIEPGLNNISIPLDAVRNAPETRQMDMHDIDLIIIFPKSPAENLVLYLDNIRLE